MARRRPRPWQVRAWPRRVRRAVAAVLVANVALGMAFSVIGLRRQGDERARVQLQLSAWTAGALGVQGEVWRSLATGHPTAALTRADPTAVPAGLSAADLPAVATPALRAAAAAFAVPVREVRRALAAGDMARARSAADRVETRLGELTRALDRASSLRRHEASTASTIADVETLLLMLFAAGIGLVLFRRVVATRLNGEMRAARERSRAQARFGSLVRHSSDLISIVDLDSTVTFQSDSAQAVLGHRSDDLVGTPLFDLVHPEDRARMVAAHDALLDGAGLVSTTARMRAADGTWRHVDSVHNDLRADPTVGGVVVTSRDVSERVALESQLRHSAFHDDLTGLANRALFTDRVEHALARSADDDHGPLVVFLDLDDFKTVNDTLGHGAGDTLLRAVAERLRTTVRAADTVARLGGDEFAVLAEDRVDADELTGRILAALREPVQLPGHTVSVHASLGLATGRPGLDAGAVLANADLAMYAAKAAGKDTALPFTPDLGEQALVRLRLKAELRTAVAEDQIHPWFQPTVTLATGRFSGFEALARWAHPVRGTVMPNDFIPVAEQTGLIVDIGRSVLRQACATLARWHRARPDHAHLTMAVNLSARELEEPDLVEVVAATLRDTGLDPSRLTLEVTESLLVSDPERAGAQLAGLRALGVRIAIDDFGTGYSSLGYLEQLPADIVKIDKSFVDRLSAGQPHVVVESIAQLAGALGLQTVAEGIEELPQADVLVGLGCDLGQGYLYSRPVPEAEMTAVLAAQPVTTAPALRAVDRPPRPHFDAPPGRVDVA